MISFLSVLIMTNVNVQTLKKNLTIPLDLFLLMILGCLLYFQNRKVKSKNFKIRRHFVLTLKLFASPLAVTFRRASALRGRYRWCVQSPAGSSFRGIKKTATVGILKDGQISEIVNYFESPPIKRCSSLRLTVSNLYHILFFYFFSLLLQLKLTT